MMFDEFEELCKKLSAIKKRDYSKYVTLWLLSTPKDRDELSSLLELEHQKHKRDELWLAPPPDDGKGNGIALGRVLCQEEELHEFTLSRQDLLRHVTIFGHSGSGKTNLGYLLLQGLLRDGMPFLVFDWKRNYRDLLAMKHEVDVYTVGRDVRPFRLNPLVPPPGTSAETWLKKITEVIARAYYVGEGVMSILHRGIDAMYQEFGVYQGVQTRWPTLQDVKAWIEGYVARASMKEIKAQWVASTQRTLQSLCFGETDQVLNVQQSTPVDQLLSRPVILELDALGEADKNLIVETLLLWIHHYRMQEREREQLKHVIVIEEAHHVLRHEELGVKESILDVVIREIRELGEGIVMMDQSPAQFSQNAVGNSGTSFVFALKDKTDVNTAANFLLLEGEEKHYLNLLAVGTCVVKCQSEYRKPFLLRVPHIRVPKGEVRDEHLCGLEGVPETLAKGAMELYAAMRELQELKEMWNESPSGDSETEEPPPNQQSSDSGSSDVERIVEQLDDLSIRFLRDVLARPMAGLSSRYAKMEVSVRNGNKTKNWLEEQGVIRIVSVNKGDATIKLVELTALGKRLARRAFPDWRVTKQLRGGAEHRYWQDRVATALESEGLEVEREKKLNGDSADVVTKDTAIEVETGKSNIRKNIEKNLEVGNDVLVLPTNKKARKKVNRVLRR